jgi:hypothetical protein
LGEAQLLVATWAIQAACCSRVRQCRRGIEYSYCLVTLRVMWWRVRLHVPAGTAIVPLRFQRVLPMASSDLVVGVPSKASKVALCLVRGQDGWLSLDG